MCGLIMFCVVFCFVFFFKQKTAYEMRISDWSSDVCSSDLAAQALGTDLRRTRLRLLVGTAIGVGGAVAVSGAIGFVGLIVPHLKIGRASCRERVCQYV